MMSWGFYFTHILTNTIKHHTHIHTHIDNLSISIYVYGYWEISLEKALNIWFTSISRWCKSWNFSDDAIECNKLCPSAAKLDTRPFLQISFAWLQVLKTVWKTPLYVGFLYTYPSRSSFETPHYIIPLQHHMTSSNGNSFRVTSPFWWESSGHRWVPLRKASDAELWCFFICAWTNDWANNRDACDLRRHSTHYDVTVMKGISFSYWDS